MTHFPLKGAATKNAMIVVALALMALSLPAAAAANEGRGRSLALGVSLIAGPSTGEDRQMITGWDQATVYTSTGGFDINSQGVVLRRNGLYQVTVEGALFFDADDTSAPDDAAGLFSLAIRGFEIGSCSTPENANAPTVPVVWQFPGRERAATCRVTFTIRVQGDGELTGFPVVFPRRTPLQVFLYPNDRPLGDQTLRLVRMEVTRIGS